MASSASKPELVAVVGETASGKSELAMRIAREFDGEIIAADSWTVYKGFDIGTSKPSAAERAEIPHHLIDVADPTAGFNAPKFKDLADAAAKDIKNRGKLAILVGGTGLYVDSFLYDFGFLPNAAPAERARLDGLPLPELLGTADKQKIDLTDVDVRNKRRVIRAIEAGGQKPTKGELRPGTLIVGLKLDNKELRERVEARTDKLIESGLEQEVKKLAAKYGWDVEPMKGIGYLQWREYFEGSQTLEQTRERIISATMSLAKRQRTWFKRNPGIHWFGSIGEADSFIRERLNT